MSHFLEKSQFLGVTYGPKAFLCLVFSLKLNLCLFF